MPATQIMVELRPLLRQYTVYPKYVDNPGIENGAHPKALAVQSTPRHTAAAVVDDACHDCFCCCCAAAAALPEMLASRLLPDQVEQEAAWKAAMPGGLQQLAAQPREAMDYANDQVGDVGRSGRDRTGGGDRLCATSSTSLHAWRPVAGSTCTVHTHHMHHAAVEAHMPAAHLPAAPTPLTASHPPSRLCCRLVSCRRWLGG